MEQRRSPRRPIHLNVSLVSPVLGLISGRATDISEGGMFVRTAPGLYLAHDQRMEVHFPSLEGAEPLAARVVRSDRHGAALRFLGPAPDLRAWRRAPERPPAGPAATAASTALF